MYLFAIKVIHTWDTSKDDRITQLEKEVQELTAQLKSQTDNLEKVVKEASFKNKSS